MYIGYNKISWNNYSFFSRSTFISFYVSFFLFYGQPYGQPRSTSVNFFNLIVLHLSFFSVNLFLILFFLFYLIILIFFIPCTTLFSIFTFSTFLCFLMLIANSLLEGICVFGLLVTNHVLKIS